MNVSASSSFRPRPATSPWNNLSFFICAFLVVTTLATYWPSFHFSFVNYDDPDYVTANPMVRQGLTGHGIAWAFLSSYADNWHPLTWLSHMLDVAVFGLAAGPMHVENVLLHAANAVLLFLVLKQLTASLRRSAFVAALFALHPLHVESVAWISERKDVLSTFFGLLAVWFYTLHAQPRPERIAHRLNPFSIALFFFALALMSKPMLVTLPFVFLLLDFWPLNRKASFYSLLQEKVPFFMLCVLACLLTFYAQQRGGAMQASALFSPMVRIETSFVAYATYLEKMFWPTNLSCLDLHPGHWPLHRVLPAALLVIGLSLFAVLSRRHLPFLFVGWFWFLGMLVPTIGLVQVGWQYVADRYTYLPLVGIFIVMIWGGGELARRRRATVVPSALLGFAVLLACTVQTRRQLGFWRNSESLFLRACTVDDHNDVAYNNLGFYYFQAGRLDEARIDFRRAMTLNPAFKKCRDNLVVLGQTFSQKQDFPHAIDCFELVLASRTNVFTAQTGLATAFLKSGRLAEAIAHYRTAALLNPSDAPTYNNLGIALALSGHADEGITNFQQALLLNPAFTDAFSNLGDAFMAQKRYEDAAQQYKNALLFSLDDAILHFDCGKALVLLGKNAEAAVEFREALRLKPDFQEAERALNSLPLP